MAEDGDAPPRGPIVEPEDLKEIKTSVKELGETAEKLHNRQGFSAWFQVVTAVLTVLVALATAYNNLVLGRIKETAQEIQAAQAARQIDITIGTAILHETLMILDTTDKNVRAEKVNVHRLLLTALVRQDASASAGGQASSLHDFYTQLLAALPSAPPAAAVAISPSREAVYPGDPSKTTVDVFWCVGHTPYPKTNKNETQAAELFQRIVAKQPDEGLGRIRL
jgi:hypothetical protein